MSRKFFTLFQGKDGSLYIHPNRVGGWRTPVVETTDSGLMLDLNAVEVSDFQLHKITFHQSGYIHLTDKGGQRLKDGIRGPSFEEMDTLYLFCIIVPSKLEDLPEFTGDKKTMVVNLEVPKNVPPFFVTLALLKGAAPEEETDETRLSPRFVLPLQSGYNLTFVLRAVKHADGNSPATWPPFPYFLLRTRA